MWGDHGFLRARFRNLHRISPEMWRANQPSPEHIARYVRDMNIRTIINLRGASAKGYYVLEREACERLGVALVDFQVFSRDMPAPATVLAAKTLFDTIAYPALMHCKSGADRAGLMSVLYRHFRMGDSIETATKQLSLKYLHVREGKTGILDFFFHAYLREFSRLGVSFSDWIANGYDPAALKAKFLAGWRSRIPIDQMLGRE